MDAVLERLRSQPQLNCAITSFAAFQRGLVGGAALPASSSSQGISSSLGKSIYKPQPEMERRDLIQCGASATGMGGLYAMTLRETNNKRLLLATSVVTTLPLLYELYKEEERLKQQKN